MYFSVRFLESCMPLFPTASNKNCETLDDDEVEEIVEENPPCDVVFHAVF